LVDVRHDSEYTYIYIYNDIDPTTTTAAARHCLTIWITNTMMLMIRVKIHHNAPNSCRLRRLHNRNGNDTTTTNNRQYLLYDVVNGQRMKNQTPRLRTTFQ